MPWRARGGRSMVMRRGDPQPVERARGPRVDEDDLVAEARIESEKAARSRLKAHGAKCVEPRASAHCQLPLPIARRLMRLGVSGVAPGHLFRMSIKRVARGQVGSERNESARVRANVQLTGLQASHARTPRTTSERERERATLRLHRSCSALCASTPCGVFLWAGLQRARAWRWRRMHDVLAHDAKSRKCLEVRRIPGASCNLPWQRHIGAGSTQPPSPQTPKSKGLLIMPQHARRWKRASHTHSRPDASQTPAPKNDSLGDWEPTTSLENKLDLEIQCVCVQASRSSRLVRVPLSQGLCNNSLSLSLCATILNRLIISSRQPLPIGVSGTANDSSPLSAKRSTPRLCRNNPRDSVDKSLRASCGSSARCVLADNKRLSYRSDARNTKCRPTAKECEEEHNHTAR